MKYFCENAPQYHIACTGSLPGIALAKYLETINTVESIPDAFFNPLYSLDNLKLEDDVLNIPLP